MKDYLAKSALADLDTGERPKMSEIYDEATSSLFMLTPVEISMPFNIYRTSSVATLPLAPLA